MAESFLTPVCLCHFFFFFTLVELTPLQFD